MLKTQDWQAGPEPSEMYTHRNTKSSFNGCATSRVTCTPKAQGWNGTGHLAAILLQARAWHPVLHASSAPGLEDEIIRHLGISRRSEFCRCDPTCIRMRDGLLRTKVQIPVGCWSGPFVASAGQSTPPDPCQITLPRARLWQALRPPPPGLQRANQKLASLARTANPSSSFFAARNGRMNQPPPPPPPPPPALSRSYLFFVGIVHEPS